MPFHRGRIVKRAPIAPRISLRDAIGTYRAAGGRGRADNEFLRFDRPGLRAGDTLPNSRIWDDGVITDEELPGTSALDPMASYAPLDLDSSYDGVPYVITGERVGSGEDAGEHVIANATIVRPL